MRSVPVPSSSVNWSSFLLFLTASQALTFTARKSLLEKVSKSTAASNSGSISTLEKSITGLAVSAAGTAAGGKTGLTAIVVGIGFLLMLFFQPVATLVPSYATAPALMYVGLLMLSNVSKLDFNDFVGAMSGLVCAVFIVLTANIVTGIMLGFAALVIGRIVSGDVKNLNLGTVLIAIALVAFYAFGWAI